MPRIRRRIIIEEPVSCRKCGILLGTFPVTINGKKKKNEKLARHNELYHSGFYTRDSKGNFVKNEKDLSRISKFTCPFCSKVIGPQELIDNVGNRFVQIKNGLLKGKAAHRNCFDLAVTLGEIEDNEEEKLDADETYQL